MVLFGPPIVPMARDLMQMSESIAQTIEQMSQVSQQAVHLSIPGGQVQAISYEYMQHVLHAMHAIENLRFQTAQYLQYAESIPAVMVPVNPDGSVMPPNPHPYM